MPKLEVEGVGMFDVPEDKRLVLAIEEDAGVDFMHRCGSSAACTTCWIECLEGEPEKMTCTEICSPAACPLAHAQCHFPFIERVRFWGSWPRSRRRVGSSVLTLYGAVFLATQRLHHTPRRRGGASPKCSIYYNFLHELRRTPLRRSSSP